ncbi:trimeric autotransporter adhesin, partial [Pseudogracilibacillus auburnensis]
MEEYEIFTCRNALSYGMYNVMIGSRASNDPNEARTYQVAIGYNTSTTATSAVAIGANSRVSAQRSVAIGAYASSPNSGIGVLGTSHTLANGTYNWQVPGSFTVSGTKNFEIPHPHPDKKDTHRLRHAAVESPTAGDTLYRYTIEAVRDNETVKMLLPDYFQYLNKNVDVWVNGHMHFGRAFGIVEDGELKVTCESAGEYKVLVIG